ncbi:hypothetical protein QN219_13790 [Sinorhizobium sp. 7-81]|uniref:hypothetical protein n=1 Tax=Sinorhizobium sp. 8-89 TaxID=3049089 RepID=UPI0024C249B1|nr:hypothetical protein [Sinorhizobium sp. 8-89]MDK1491133.1 hypothetical protein [Sinorhizobium sp. 8-89]
MSIRLLAIFRSDACGSVKFPSQFWIFRASPDMERLWNGVGKSMKRFSSRIQFQFCIDASDLGRFSTNPGRAHTGEPDGRKHAQPHRPSFPKDE